jgi:predicted PurR-regulated permease PerM
MTKMPGDSADRAFVRRVFVVVAVAAVVAAVWVLSDILLLLFGAILVAVILHTIADPLQAHLGMARPLALLLSGTMIVLVLAAAGFYFGPELVAELRSVFSTLPEAANRLAGHLQLGSFADMIRNGAAASTLGGLASRIIAWSTTIAGVLASLLLIVFGGIYLAIDPASYRDGLVKLIPPAIQPNVRATLDDAAAALKGWLAGQAIAMLLVGAFTGLGLWLVGVPSALALGFISGLAEFVPLIGPLLAAIPALLLASTVGGQTVLLALAVLIVVQQVESNLITPLIADRMASIPPAVGLFAVVAMGVLFGPLGLVLGFPLTIIFNVAIRRLYVRDTLGEKA